MKYGTPVLASAISAVTEVCQNSVLYFSPYAIDEMKNRILNLDNDQETYQRLSRNGLKRYKELIKEQNKNKLEEIETILGIKE